MTDNTQAELTSLPFVVVESTSEEHGCEATTLHNYNEEGTGWQSEKASQYNTQTLVLKVQHEDKKRVVHALEILCHENKIAEKIEISLFSHEGGDAPSSFKECSSVCHLGYITLDPNQRSGFHARELKSIPIEKPCDYIQLVLQGCHSNDLNVHKQVGIVGIRVLGMTHPEGEALNLAEKEEQLAVVTRSERSTKHSSASPMNTVRTASTSLPKKIEIPSLRPVLSLPSHVRAELSPQMQSSVDRMERLKKERASVEDFDTAGQIKENLGSVYALLVAYMDTQQKMKDAAAAEDYALASRLKSERDTNREAASQALSDVERQFNDQFDDMRIGDLSISTIKDDSFVSQRSKKLSPKKFSSPTPKKMLSSSTQFDSSSIMSHPEGQSESSEEKSQDNSSSSENGEHPHPLEGVENAEELPAPEEINGNALPDMVHKVEDLFGEYRTKCLFSKNWILREAALAKMTLLVPDVFSDSNGDCAEALCNIIELGVDDVNQQVYLAALILLDETILQLEDIGLSQSKASPLFSRIIINLLGKLADSKHKVAESAELALLSMASSSCIDSTSIINTSTKRIRSKDAKGGRTAKARLLFLENMAAEFGDSVFGDAACKRVVDFAIKGKLFEHKDGGVRDAAKDCTVTLMAIHGDDSCILRSLQDCVSDKQLNEFRSRLATIKQS